MIPGYRLFNRPLVFFILQVRAENPYIHEFLITSLTAVQVNIISLSSFGTATWSFSKETGKVTNCFVLNNLYNKWDSFFVACNIYNSVLAICGHITLHWRHNDHGGVSNHQPHDCLFNRLFRRRSKKTSKLRVTGLCAGNSLGPVNSPHKGPVTRKLFPLDDVVIHLMASSWIELISWYPLYNK